MFENENPALLLMAQSSNIFDLIIGVQRKHAFATLSNKKMQLGYVALLTLSLLEGYCAAPSTDGPPAAASLVAFCMRSNVGL